MKLSRATIWLSQNIHTKTFHCTKQNDCHNYMYLRLCLECESNNWNAWLHTHAQCECISTTLSPQVTAFYNNFLFYHYDFSSHLYMLAKEQLLTTISCFIIMIFILIHMCWPIWVQQKKEKERTWVQKFNSHTSLNI